MIVTETNYFTSVVNIIFKQFILKFIHYNIFIFHKHLKNIVKPTVGSMQAD